MINDIFFQICYFISKGTKLFTLTSDCACIPHIRFCQDNSLPGPLSIYRPFSMYGDSHYKRRWSCNHLYDWKFLYCLYDMIMMNKVPVVRPMSLKINFLPMYLMGSTYDVWQYWHCLAGYFGPWHTFTSCLGCWIIMELDSFTVSLHSPNGRHLPAIRVVQGDCQWSMKNSGNSHQSREPTLHCETRQS